MDEAPVDPGMVCKWLQWKTVDKKSCRVASDGSVEQLMGLLKSQWVKFLLHCYVKDTQSHYSESCMSGIDKTTAVQVEFSENFQTVGRMLIRRRTTPMSRSCYSLSAFGSTVATKVFVS